MSIRNSKIKYIKKKFKKNNFLNLISNSVLSIGREMPESKKSDSFKSPRANPGPKFLRKSCLYVAFESQITVAFLLMFKNILI